MLPAATLALCLSTASALAATEVSVFVFRDGLPLPQVAVLAGEQVLAHTDDAGFARLEVSEGDHTLVFQHEGAILAESTVRVGEQPLRLTLRVADSKAKVEVLGADVAAPAASNAPALGRLQGKVLDREGAPLPGAQVLVSGVSEGAITGADGAFDLAVPAGTYVVSAILAGYTTGTKREVVVRDGEITEVSFALTPRGLEMEEVVVTAPHVEGSLASVLDARRTSEQVAEVLGAEQMARAGDSDAADALKRVTGLTVVGGRYVYVRGLGDRYSTTLLNGATLPSPDPTRRVVPLDLFPTDMLGSVTVQKTYSPNLPGEFSGGAVVLGTRGAPEEGFLKVGLSLKGNSRTTFIEGLHHQGGSLDFLGIDDGHRALPAELRELTQGGKRSLTSLTPEERERAGESFDNIYDTRGATLPPGFGLELSAGERFGGEDTYLAVLGTALYENDWRYRVEKRARLALQGGADAPLTQMEVANLRRTEQSITLGGMLDLVGQLGPHHQVEAIGLVSRKTDDRVLASEGLLVGEQREQRSTTLQWVEQQILAAQVRGVHTLPALGNLEAKWLYTGAQALRDQPDERSYRYARRRIPGLEPDAFELAATTALGRNPVERSFESLLDMAHGVNADLRLPMTLGELLQLEASAGFHFENIQRDADVHRYRFQLPSPPPPALAARLDSPSLESLLGPDDVGPGAWELQNANLGSDSYTGRHRIWAGYAMLSLSLADWVDVVGGARYEDSSILVRTSQLSNPAELDIAELHTKNVLPGASATAHLTEQVQVRGAYSRTLNRPQLKELSPVPFTDPETRFVREGNPNLTQAQVSNYDVRAEWYWSEAESLSVAAFYKDFADPIERVIAGGGPNGDGVRRYANVSGATNLGVELEGRLRLWRLWGGLHAFALSGNVSLIRSRVSIDAEEAQLLTNINRPLEGQSPWVVNAQLDYDDEDLGLAGSVSFNVYGPRIFEVGVKGLPDAYEQPTPTLDLALRYRVTHGFTLAVKARNLLDPSVRVT